MGSPIEAVIGQLEVRDCAPRRCGSGWSALCPAHPDRSPSLSISTGTDGCVLIKCHAGCAFEAILAALDLIPSSLFSKEANPNAAGATAIYDYQDESGELLYQVVRRTPKGFYCRRPDGKDGWVNNLRSTRKVPYRLPDLIAGIPSSDTSRIFVVEGEKDVDRLFQQGLLATTNSGGAGKWTLDHSSSLKAAGAAEIVIVPDNDDAGDRHVQIVGAACTRVGLAVRVLRLPWGTDLLSRTGQDASDWLDRGHTVDELLEAALAAPPFASEEGRSTTAMGLPLVSIGELLSEPNVEQEWLVDGVLPSGGLSVLAGKPKAGKSTEARVLAHCIVGGRKWLGRATKHGPVFYLALEEKRSQVRKHFERMGTGADDPLYVFVSSLPEDGLEQLRMATESQKPVLVIVDTLIRAVRIKDLNDYAAVMPALEPFLALARETGAHVLFVHHMGKGERRGPDGILGSTAIYATVDTALLLVRSDRYRTISSFQRYGDDLPETVLELDPTTGLTSLGGSREEMDRAFVGEALVAGLRGTPSPLPEKDVLGVVEGRKQGKERTLRDLVAGGRIQRTGRGVKGDPYLYSLPVMLPPTQEREGEFLNSSAPEPIGETQNSPSQNNSLSPDGAQVASPSPNGSEGWPLYGPWEPVEVGPDHEI